MKTLHSFGQYNIEEVDIEKAKPNDNQILVKSYLTGICRSDIMAYTRNENMPYYSDKTPNGIIGTFGHEGLGVVVKVGKNIKDVKIGDIVATISDNAYAEYFVADYSEYVIIPEIAPKYILQPTACAINIIEKTLKHSKEDILLIGSGFMSVIISQYTKYHGIDLTVVGNSNLQHFSKILPTIPNKKYKTIIDLSSKADNFYKIMEIADVESIICYAATPSIQVQTNFFELCWQACTIIMPSPRNKDFKNIMKLTSNLISNNIIDPSPLWSKEYDYKDFKSAFEEGANRSSNYGRGYLKYE